MHTHARRAHTHCTALLLSPALFSKRCPMRCSGGRRLKWRQQRITRPRATAKPRLAPWPRRRYWRWYQQAQPNGMNRACRASCSSPCCLPRCPCRAVLQAAPPPPASFPSTDDAPCSGAEPTVFTVLVLAPAAGSNFARARRIDPAHLAVHRPTNPSPAPCPQRPAPAHLQVPEFLRSQSTGTRARPTTVPTLEPQASRNATATCAGAGMFACLLPADCQQRGLTLVGISKHCVVH